MKRSRLSKSRKKRHAEKSKFDVMREELRLGYV